MDAKQERLQKKLEELLKQASSVATELQKLEQGPGTPLRGMPRGCRKPEL